MKKGKKNGKGKTAKPVKREKTEFEMEVQQDKPKGKVKELIESAIEGVKSLSKKKSPSQNLPSEFLDFQKEENEKQTSFEQAAHESGNPEILDSMNELRGKFDKLEEMFINFKKDNENVRSKEVLMGIAQNINTSLVTMGHIDSKAAEIINRQEDVRQAILSLENQNKLHEATHLRDMVIGKFYTFFDQTLTEHKVLRNDLEQLQHKIRNA